MSEAKGLPSEAGPATAATTHRAGIAPVKAEFLCPIRPAACAVSTPAAPTDPAVPTASEPGETTAPAAEATAPATEAAASTDVPEPDAQPARKKQRGMNKNRSTYRPDAGKTKMCAAVVEGRGCKFGDSCRFSHDLVAFTASRPADLGTTCPIYDVRGFCRYGVTCRYGTTHINTDGSNFVKAGGDGEAGAGSMGETELNAVSADLTHLLRRNKYDFSRAVSATPALPPALPPSRPPALPALPPALPPSRPPRLASPRLASPPPRLA